MDEPPPQYFPQVGAYVSAITSQASVEILVHLGVFYKLHGGVTRNSYMVNKDRSMFYNFRRAMDGNFY